MTLIPMSDLGFILLVALIFAWTVFRLVMLA
jgi:hypothetical protein